MEDKLSVMVVDDTETNIDILLDTLGDEYDVRVATDGKVALNYIYEDHPDLILLDIMMPVMDGYEVCRILKSEEKTSHIPIIFLTAMSEDNDEQKGLLLGAVDYITKPFNPSLVKVRVNNQLQLKYQQDQLKKQNEILIENSKLKEDIERISQHDLKSPLNGIMNYPLLIQKEGNISDTQNSFLNKILESGRKMLNMINLSLDLYKMEQGAYNLKVTDINVLSVIYNILGEYSLWLKSRKLEIIITLNDQELKENDEFIIAGEELLFYSMLANLFKNAAEATDRGAQVLLKLSSNSSREIEIHNPGVIPEEIRETFFEKYSTSGKDHGTGLGTYSARLIAETLGGSISYTSSEDEGTSIKLLFQK